MPTLEGTFFRRGGLYSDGEKAGLFAFFRDSGIAYQFNSWRTAISVDKSNPYR